MQFGCREFGLKDKLIAAVGQHSQLQWGNEEGEGETPFRSTHIPHADGKDPILAKEGHFALTRSTRIMGPW